MQDSCFDFCACAHDNASAPRLVCAAYALCTHDVSTSGEVGAFDVRHESVGVDFRIFDVCYASVDDFTNVVCGHVRRHSHGDARSTVHKERGDACGQYAWLRTRIVVVRHHVHSFLLNVLHHHFSHYGEFRFGVSHRCSTVAVHRAEVSLSDDEGIAHGPGLRHAHQGVVYRTVAMRMVFSQNLSHYGCRLLCCLFVGDTHVPHSVEDAAVNGFETVADIREGTADDDTHRIVDIGRLHLVLNVHMLNPVCFLYHCLLFCFFGGGIGSGTAMGDVPSLCGAKLRILRRSAKCFF